MLLVLVSMNMKILGSSELTEKPDQVTALSAPGRKHAKRIGFAGVFTTDLDGNCGTSGTCLDAVCGGKLDEIGHADTGVGLDGLEVSA